MNKPTKVSQILVNYLKVYSEKTYILLYTNVLVESRLRFCILQYPTQQKHQLAEKTEQQTARLAALLRAAGIDFEQL
jgi:hypothetical protein